MGERCLSEHDVGPELTCEDWAFSQESCIAHSEWCYFDPVDGCNDKETIGLAVLQKSHISETTAEPISGLKIRFRWHFLFNPFIFCCHCASIETKKVTGRQTHFLNLELYPHVHERHPKNTSRTFFFSR